MLCRKILFILNNTNESHKDINKPTLKLIKALEKRKKDVKSLDVDSIEITKDVRQLSKKLNSYLDKVDRSDKVIVHFTGHGNPNGHWIGKYIKNKSITSIFQDPRIDLVFFSNCHSKEISYDLMNRDYVPITIGVDHELGVDFALAFEKIFYKELLLQKNYYDAFENAFSIADDQKDINNHVVITKNMGGNLSFENLNDLKIYFKYETDKRQYFITPKLSLYLDKRKKKEVNILYCPNLSEKQNFIHAYGYSEVDEHVDLFVLEEEYLNEFGGADSEIEALKLHIQNTEINLRFVVYTPSIQNTLDQSVKNIIYNSDYLFKQDEEPSRINYFHIKDRFEKTNFPELVGIPSRDMRYFMNDYYIKDYPIPENGVEGLFENDDDFRTQLRFRTVSLENAKKATYKFEFNPSSKEVNDSTSVMEKTLLNLIVLDTFSPQMSYYISNYIKFMTNLNGDNIIIDLKLGPDFNDLFVSGFKNKLSKKERDDFFPEDIPRMIFRRDFSSNFIFIDFSGNEEQIQNQEQNIEAFLVKLDEILNKAKSYIDDKGKKNRITILVQCRKNNSKSILEYIHKKIRLMKKENQDLNNHIFFSSFKSPNDLSDTKYLDEYLQSLKFIISNQVVEFGKKMKPILEDHIKDGCQPMVCIKEIISEFRIPKKQMLKLQ